MYLTPTERHWACDIEADNLLDKATTIWCVCVENIITGEKHEFGGDGADRRFIDWLRGRGNDYVLVGHNFLAYDLVMLNRHWKAGIPVSRVVDTFVLSQLYNPTFAGGHSLDMWGKRVRMAKTDHKDFSRYTPEMLAYCKNDTSLTALVYRKLSERMRQVGFSEEGCQLEHLAWNVIQNKQKRNGFPFDKRKAEALYIELRAREEELKREIYQLWPPQLLPIGEYAGTVKKNGENSVLYEKHVSQFPRVQRLPGNRHRVYDWIEFNLGSPDQRVKKLLELGWQPTQFTKKTPKGGGGNPKVDEDSLIAFAETSGKTEVAAIAKWIVVNSRANMVNTWLEAYNENTGAVHGSLFIASTLRYRHSSPNSANIPAVRQKKDENGVEHVQYGEAGAWTYESRDLWTCGNPDEWSLVGIDGTGIQNRCLIHNLIKTVGEEAVADFKELALRGDVHKHNINVLGLANKAAAKKFYYTLMMGGGGARLAADQAQFGTILTAKEGEALKDKMISSIPGFHKLIANLERELDRTGRITLCDGTPILVPSPHMVIPYLLQGDESRLMKRATHYVDQACRANKWQEHVFKVADIHDEWQFKVRNEYVEAFIEKALPCFPRAGESFGYLIQIDGDYKVGKTWAETH